MGIGESRQLVPVELFLFPTLWRSNFAKLPAKLTIILTPTKLGLLRLGLTPWNVRGLVQMHPCPVTYQNAINARCSTPTVADVTLSRARGPPSPQLTQLRDAINEGR